MLRSFGVFSPKGIWKLASGKRPTRAPPEENISGESCPERAPEGVTTLPVPLQGTSPFLVFLGRRSLRELALG